MATNSNPLQGSLFGTEATLANTEIEEKSYEQKFNKLSDKELADDAAKRPRKAKKVPSSSKNHYKKNFSDKDDLPNWHNHKLVNQEELTPVLQHYVELKRANPERVLLYRLGDFFECFFEDAIKLSQILELTLTGKEGGKTIGRVPMAGIPHHAAERYCSDLIKKGLSVSICDQLETNAEKGGLIKRAITRILTPGTVIEEGMLQARKNNWLASVFINENSQSLNWGLARADVSTGEFCVQEGDELTALFQELNKLEPSEVIWGELESAQKPKWLPDNIHLTKVAKTIFSEPEVNTILKQHYKLANVNGLGLESYPYALRAAGGLLSYLKNTNPVISERTAFTSFSEIPLDFPKINKEGEFLIIDAQTKRNLEITATQKGGQYQGSLLWAIDQTLTAMGGRCLRRWIEEPLMNLQMIKDRQNTIGELINSRSLRKTIRKLLRSMGDLERLAGRVGTGHSGARDLIAISDGIERLPSIAESTNRLSDNGPKWLSSLKKPDKELIKMAQAIKEQLVENPPLSLSEGGLINDSVDPLLDGIRNQLDDQEKWLDSQEAIERKLSQNNNLRLQYHRTFGYFLAVSKAKSSNVPSHWIRRQTLANEERFITPELKKREGKILQLKVRSYQREYEIFCKLRDFVGDHTESIRKVARAISGLDALSGLAEVAATQGYCRPSIVSESSTKKPRSISVKESRHPVVEQILVEKDFIPNDFELGDGVDLIILTGPNASGKSCYLRQIGLIQLMSQIGSWVPAESAIISIADRIFTRVGAVDDLATGQSTFMVEMTETASILNQATTNSLVLLDEIGRGTATYDGLSIAWSVSEHLAQKIKSRTIFATHYHELNSLSSIQKNTANFQVLVKEKENELLFLHKVVSGGSSRSYGIEAARLAGVPKDVIKRARDILKMLEKKENIQ